MKVKKQYSKDQLELAAMAKALGHPARVAILDILMKVDACICGNIVDELPLAQPTVSQHLKELKYAGLIKGEVDGNAICYCINEKGIKKLMKYFQKIQDKLERNNHCC